MTKGLVDARPFYQFGAIAAAAAGVAYYLPGGWSLYFTWAFACYVLLVACYALKGSLGRDPARYLKPGRGIGWVATLPMTIFNRIALNFFWATLREDAISDLGHGLYLSARLLPRHEGLFRKLGIRAVVDLCSEFEEVGFVRRDSRIDEIACPNLDLTPPSAHEIERLRDWTLVRLRRGEPVLIHCAYGHGRSYAVALAVLKALEPQKTLAELETQVKAVRPRAHLSKSQRRLVEAVVT